VIELSARELGLLEVLLQRIGRLVSKEQLVDHLCEWGEEVSNNAIEVYVHRLRKKIEPSGVRILTVRGLGYCLEKAAPATSTVATPALSATSTPSVTPEAAAPSSPASAAMPASHHFK
jgi:two-component system OmpR family response regulator